MAQFIVKQQCHALTRAKKQCRNKIVVGNRKYCKLHSKSSKNTKNTPNTRRKLLKQEVSFAEAKKRFEQLPKRTQQADIARKASEKNLYTEPNKFWLQNPSKHGDVLSIDTPDEFGMFDAFKQGVNSWIVEINAGKKLSKKVKDQLVDNFHSLRISDARKLIKKIKNPTFLKYLVDHSNVKTHPHLRKAARIQLILLE